LSFDPSAVCSARTVPDDDGVQGIAEVAAARALRQHNDQKPSWKCLS
jgi:hypothetical protein